MSKFQQRHYEAIAEVLQDAREVARLAITDGHEVNPDKVSKRLQGIEMVENLLVDLFRRDNCHFMPERFRKACQPGANVKARS